MEEHGEGVNRNSYTNGYARGIKKKNVWETKNDGITSLSSVGWGILYREFVSDTGWHLCVKPIGTGGNEKFQTRFAPQPAPPLIRRVSTLGIYYADLPRADVPRKNSVTPIQTKCFEANDTNFHASTCPNEAFNPLLLRRFPNARLGQLYPRRSISFLLFLYVARSSEIFSNSVYDKLWWTSIVASFYPPSVKRVVEILILFRIEEIIGWIISISQASNYRKELRIKLCKRKISFNQRVWFFYHLVWFSQIYSVAFQPLFSYDLWFTRFITWSKSPPLVEKMDNSKGKIKAVQGIRRRSDARYFFFCYR